MSDLLAVAVVSGIFNVVILVLGVLLKRDVKNVQSQVDTTAERTADRSTTNQAKLEQLVDGQAAIREDLEVMRNHLKRLWHRVGTHSSQLEEMEYTAPPRSRFHPAIGRHKIEREDIDEQ